MSMHKNIALLRKEMEKNGIDIYIVPTSDPHQSEYVSEHWKSREWLSGFTGSAGTVVVTRNEAGLWTDGRYFIQAEKELRGSGIDLYKMGMEGVPSLESFISARAKKGDVVGFFGQLMSVSKFKSLQSRLKGIEINSELDMIGNIWTDRPEQPLEKVFIHEEKYAGESSADKIKRLREIMREKKADYYMVSSLDEIAWLFNIRGGDVKNNPVTISYALISEDEAVLFIDQRKLSDDVKAHVELSGAAAVDIGCMKDHLKKLTAESTVLICPEKTSVCVKSMIPEKCKVEEGEEMLTELEAVRNDVQTENLRDVQARDGAVMVKVLKWIYEHVEFISERDVQLKLDQLRREHEDFLEPSFDTIAAYKEHGAMMHYSVSEESNAILKKEGLLLIDTGGQYFGGTTDITRTISLGNPTDQERKDYTLTLKGMIALSELKFLEGSSGANLDATARQFLWKEGIDYKCGTGHGVGYFLGVHQGNQRISPKAQNSALKSGMVVTDEPGVYREGQYGIRIENMLLVKEFKQTESGRFLEFETLTLCPIDLNLVDPTLLSEGEKNWIREYHRTVYEKLQHHLFDDEISFLKSYIQLVS